ncbi:hypothetical protein [Mycobacterium sp.]|jgi:hypothetical protein|uniref:hypothetical protein n=1 Tax=Mycobacterium sp. TaxID=1785 RepID=UPI002D30640F|nr:hypothetical protein [Mycobacterium sp.]HZA09950.1 hypothetical protein [Mycobacterium sp.]
MSVIAPGYDIDLDGHGYDPEFMSVPLPLPTLTFDRDDPAPFAAINIDGRHERRQLWMFDPAWPDLEDHVLGRAADRKISVLSGPVPGSRRSWKIIAMVRGDGTLSVTAYLLYERSGERRVFQVPVWRIAEHTGLNLDRYMAADPLEINSPPRKLARLDEIVL